MMLRFIGVLLFGILTGCESVSEGFRTRVESIELETAGGQGQYGREIRAKFVLRDPRGKQRTTSDAKAGAR